MSRIMAAALMAAFLLSVVASSAFAEAVADRPRCGPAATIERVLAEDYGERLVASGLTGAGNQYRIYAASDGRTWSAVVVTPEGLGCLVGAGTDWQMRGPSPGDPA